MCGGTGQQADRVARVAERSTPWRAQLVEERDEDGVHLGTMRVADLWHAEVEKDADRMWKKLGAGDRVEDDDDDDQEGQA